MRRLALLAGMVATWPFPAHAQRPREQQPPALKRALLAAPARPACSGEAPAPPVVTDSQRLQARELAERGQQAAILGDNATALSRLREAATLDPANPDLTYQLGRVYENADSAEAAVAAYCHFLVLAPAGADAADARSRIAALAKPTTDPAVDRANAVFQLGVSAYDRDRLAEAEASFTAAIASQPAWADPYFDRAVVRLRSGNRSGAASDFESYLRLGPGASDRTTVVAQIDQLRRPPLSSTNALALGLLVPGGGQFYTHRPVWGLVSLAAAGGAIGYAAAPRAITTTEQQTAKDPFGNPYTYTVTLRRTTHPHVVPGVALAGGIAVLGAIEAAAYVRRTQTPARRVSVVILPTAGGVLASVTLR